MIKRYLDLEKLKQLIQDYMVERGLCSLEDFALQHADLKMPTLLKILRGETKSPHPETLKRLAFALDCSVSDFISIKFYIKRLNKEEKTK